jgi:membrane protein DedA with SNARE-associated domain
MVAGTAAGFLGGICLFWLGRRLGHDRLGKIHWLPLTPKRREWPERFFKRHGAKAVFIARFIPFFPLFVVNLLAGMAKMPWRIFLFYNLMGSVVSTAGYILIGYYFGRKWKQLDAWLGPAMLCLMLAAMALIVLAVIFRHSLSGFWVRFPPPKKNASGKMNRR